MFQALCSFDYLNYSIVSSMVNLLITLNFVIKFHMYISSVYK